MPRGPVERPLRRHQTSTVFLRAPTHAWPLVSTGKISEFRSAAGNAPQLWDVRLPSLAVVYRRQPSARFDYRLMMLEGIRQEALGTISDLGLIRAGYEGPNAFARFRRDYMIREKKRFEPLRRVFVYTVRPLQPGDLEVAGLALIDHLYGEHLAQNAQKSPRSIQADTGATDRLEFARARAAG